MQCTYCFQWLQPSSVKCQRLLTLFPAISTFSLFSLIELTSVDFTKSAVDSDVVDVVEGVGITESENALTNPLLTKGESETTKMTIKLVTIAAGTANDFFYC